MQVLAGERRYPLRAQTRRHLDRDQHQQRSRVEALCGGRQDLACKDLGFALGYGREFGVPLDLAALTVQTFIRARGMYGGNAWSPQVVKLLEDAVGTDRRALGYPAKL